MSTAEKKHGKRVSPNSYDNLCGWLLAAVGVALYAYTAEPTVSFWDCGEFIVSSYGLEVGHPPGAPFYWLLSHLFSWLAAGDVAFVAYCCNLLSGIATALTAMLLYHSLLMLMDEGGQLAGPCGMACSDFVEKGQALDGWCRRGAALAAGAVYLVCDTVWFSATESEVYALAMLLASLMVWLMLRWAANQRAGKSDNLLLLVSLLAGLAVCVHFLAILVLPALFVIYCQVSPRARALGERMGARLPAWVRRHSGLWLFAGGTLMLAVVFKLLVPGWFRLLEHGGLWALGVLTLLLVGAVVMSRRAKPGFWAAMLLFFTIGLSPYLIVMLRAQASPPINEGNPATGEALAQYLRREQYEKAPLLYGRCYNSPVVAIADGKPVYAKEMNMLFPRMWRSRESDRMGYPDWSIQAGHEVEVQGYKLYKPSQIDNLGFLVGYQLGYMYLRYFMWNFSGRYSDVNGLGAVQQGQCITGLPPIDRLIVGRGVPPPRSMRSKAYNRYFLLPLIVGAIGLVAMRRRHRRAYRFVMTLFVYSGLMVVLYLNMPPYEPRERDYVFILNIYTFCLWIGYGLFAILNVKIPSAATRRLPPFAKSRSSHGAAFFSTASRKTAVAMLCMALPLLMGWQNFDDHNRHGRQAARDVACNMLNSCEKNALLFTYGDNDTFPLWYLQEVEGVRTDVTVVNLSLLSTPWYREQTAQQLARRKQLTVDMAAPGSPLEAILRGNAATSGGSSFSAESEKTSASGYRYPVYLSHYAYRDRKSRYEERLLLSGTVYRLLPLSMQQGDTIDVDASLSLFVHTLAWNTPRGTYLDETGRRFLQQYLQCALATADRLVADGRKDDAARLWQRVGEYVDLAGLDDLPLCYAIAQNMTASGCSEQGGALACHARNAAAQRLEYYNRCAPLVRQYLQYECDKLAPIFQPNEN